MSAARKWICCCGAPPPTPPIQHLRAPEKQITVEGVEEARGRRHCAVSGSCRLALISSYIHIHIYKYIFIKTQTLSQRIPRAAFLRGTGPDYQASPVKASGSGRLLGSLPCLHLVNGGEPTPISVGGERQREKKAEEEENKVFFNVSLSLSLSPSLFRPQPFLFSSSFPSVLLLFTAFLRSIFIPIISHFPAL